MLSIKRIPNYIESLKASYSFIALLKRCYLIISEVKKSVKKRELDQKYLAKDIDNDYIMMEEIDINQFGESGSSACDDSEFSYS